ncbi:MAG: CDP-diacylglycerol--glycerol-3-phosphate 3-phosphatidyltransferase [Spirochaetota bacterium]
MTLADSLTTSRLIFSPLFFIFFFAAEWFHTPGILTMVLLWFIFLTIEISDLLDGHFARKRNQTSDAGRLFDPFADSLSRLTYFFCFTISGLMPVWIFLILLYRDLGVAYIRLLASGKGFSMGARLSGKVKAWVYAIAGVAGLIVITMQRTKILQFLLIIIKPVSVVCIYSTGIIAIWSLIDYALGMLSVKRDNRYEKKNGN